MTSATGQAAAALPAMQAGTGKGRFGVLALLTAGTMINYLDRTVMGIAAPDLSRDLGLSPVTMGVVFSAFAWSYAAAQIPGGVFLDRFGNRLTYFLAVALWSVFTLLQGLAPGFYSLIAIRLGLGVAEAPCFPANSRIVTLWFPQEERARATGTYTVGEYIGLAVFAPLMFWITGRFGWHAMFIVVGLLGIAFAFVWWGLYRDPAGLRFTGEMTAGDVMRPADDAVEAASFSWGDVRLLLSHRQIWGASLGQFAGNTTLIFFVTWFPTYLATERHLGWMKVGVFGVLPFAAAGAGVLFGGWLSDRLLVRTGSASLARKLPIVTGLLLAATIVCANIAPSDALVIAILSVAFFGQGMVGLGWAVIADIAPLRLMGLTGGIYSFVTNVSGITTPLVIGLILGRTGSFVLALVFMAALALLGAAAYVFLLGEVKRIELDPV